MAGRVRRRGRRGDGQVPQLGGWEVTSWAVAWGRRGSPALEVEIWAADFDYPAVERALGGGPR